MRERDDLPFSMAEYRSRLAWVRSDMEARGVDLFMSFTPENMYYLTALNTKGYYSYQCLCVPREQEPFMITRHLEASNVPYQTWMECVDSYRDEEDPIVLTASVLERRGLAASVIAIELKSWFLTAEHYLRLRDALPRATLRDGSGLVERRRMVKSPAEIAYARQAATAAVAGLRAALEATREGVLDSEVAAAGYQARILAGSEYVASPVYVVSGPKSGLAHNNWDRQRIQQGDVVFYEVGGSVKRYHAANFRSASVGEPSDLVKRAADAVRAGLQAALETLGPGVVAAEVDAACRGTIAKLGFDQYFPHRVGYALGIAYPPTWAHGGAFSINRGVQEQLQPGMMFHIVPAVFLPGVGGLGMSETVLITDTGREILTELDRILFVR
jgi:Xaa-Pro dipeptidase